MNYPEKLIPFVNHISDKGIISRTYKEFLKLNSKNTGNLVL